MSRRFSIFALRPCGVCFLVERPLYNTHRVRIQTLKAQCGASFRGPNSLYLKPKTLDEAVSLLASPGGQILAGGTDFYPALGERLPQGRSSTSPRSGTYAASRPRVSGFESVASLPGARLFAPRCHDVLMRSRRRPGKSGRCRFRTGAPWRATCAMRLRRPMASHPFLALDAEVEMASASGRRRLPLAQFLVGNRKTLRRPDEILAAVLVPRRMEECRVGILEVGRTAISGDFHFHGRGCAAG